MMYNELFLLVENGEKYLVGDEEYIKNLTKKEFESIVEYLEKVNRVMYVTKS